MEDQERTAGIHGDERAGAQAVLPAVLGLLLALIVSFGAHGGYEHFRFYAHGYLRQQETANVEATIKLFSSSVAGFYATGYTVGLKQFPADNMVKRRIFQDIRNWEESGKFFVMDRDRIAVRNVEFLAPDMAVALVDETWFSVFQNRSTRRPISEKQANILTVRYYLKKKWGRWIIFEYEVFPQGKPLPPVPVDMVLKWE